MNDSEIYLLEEFIDLYGLDHVIQEVANVCAAKADHIRDNWQDAPLAACWDKIATKLESTSEFANKALP